MSTLATSVSAGEYGPVITLCGEADITTAATLSQVMTAQLSRGTRHLAIDAAGLSLADSAAIHVLLTAAKTLRERNGSLLLRPQSPVARVLELTSACNLLTVRGEADVAPGPGRQAGPRVLGECVRACWKYFSVLPTVTASAAPASMTGFAG